MRFNLAMKDNCYERMFMHATMPVASLKKLGRTHGDDGHVSQASSKKLDRSLEFSTTSSTDCRLFLQP